MFNSNLKNSSHLVQAQAIVRNQFNAIPKQSQGPTLTPTLIRVTLEVQAKLQPVFKVRGRMPQGQRDHSGTCRCKSIVLLRNKQNFEL